MGEVPLSAAVVDWADRLAAGDRKALARALSEIENRGPSAPHLLPALFDRATKQALRVGFTGAPGAGKSTLVDAVAARLAADGRKVAILAVDPTSPFTGGAILGDRVRMSARHDRTVEGNNVFIRSMAARGSLGGLAPAAEDLMVAFEAAGYDVLLIETVGVGQAEVDVVRLTAPTVLVLTPGLGDEVQALKAGIMEIADIFVLNKADQPGVERAEAQMKAALDLRPPDAGPRPPIIRTSATAGEGLDALVAALSDAPVHTRDTAHYWRERLRADLRRGLAEAAGVDALLNAAADEVAAGRRNPYSAVADLLRTPAQLDHIGVAVRSIDDALRLWSEALGVRAGERIQVEHEGVEVAMVPLGGPRVELLEPLSPDSVIGRFLEKRGEGLHHIAVRVEDLDRAVSAVKQRGLRLIHDEPRRGAEGYRYVFLHPKAANGVLLELIAGD